jgi:hypothetical protein
VYGNEEQMEVVFERCEEWKGMSLGDVVDVVLRFKIEAVIIATAQMLRDKLINVLLTTPDLGSGVFLEAHRCKDASKMETMRRSQSWDVKF